ncbi:MAG TPA: winged helix-turn-helix domain-containing protein [Cellvibrio sp.]|nr:winged helix-turn-helix domain-containing protein [Cellvibrio sp.]
MEKNLNLIYLSHGFTIYPHRQLIAKGDSSTQVRSKTFALLLLLLERPREVLSKRYLLDTIWDDVTVEEQVLVQSVRELRQLFGSAEIIQTYPRKGYAWAADVEKQEATSAAASVASAPEVQMSRQWLRYSAISLGLLLVFATIFYTLFSHRETSSSQTQVVIVLPVKNQVSGIDHNWVPLGAMDQLIHLLVSDKKVQVMSSDYALQIMRYAQLPRDYDTQQVARIFNVSGASLIVESQLSGTVENYRLDYKLRSKNQVQRGTLFDKDLNQAIYKLGQVIVRQTGQQLQDADDNAQAIFASELMARALEKRDQGEPAAARDLFISLKQLQPNNPLARRELIFTLIILKQFSEAKTEIEASLLQTEKDNSHELTKIYFLLGLLHWQEGAGDEALKALDQADHFADLSSEILYQAQSAQIRGSIHQERGAYELAQMAYQQSLKFDTSIRCPLGISDNHILLAQVYSRQGKYDLAVQHYNAAKHLIETHQFTDMLPKLAEAEPHPEKQLKQDK